MSLEKLAEEIAAFVQDRDWEQYHDPKNLATGLAIEAAELLEVFLWTSTDESAEHGRANRQRVAEELGDVFIYCIMLARSLDIDLLEAGFRKLAINRGKYPVDLARGNATKYDRLEGDDA
jgi:NTP pyrophosphatase (non-canonical NTP hydrolase)